MEEKILCAAIHFDDSKEYYHQPINITTGIVMCGFRHGCIFAQIGGTVKERQEMYKIYEKEQGFLTSRNRFVDRIEAYHIALIQNQILDKSQIRNSTLYSEDLY